MRKRFIPIQRAGPKHKIFEDLLQACILAYALALAFLIGREVGRGEPKEVPIVTVTRAQ